MHTFGILLQLGILWFLITLFTDSTNSSQSLRETWIVLFGVMLVGLLSRLFLGDLIGPFTAIIEIAVLYLLIDKVCGTDRRSTLNICGWYLLISILINLGLAALFSS